MLTGSLRRRVRQHVNPLGQKYQTPATPPSWEEVYAIEPQPLHLDIGCGRGHFLLHMAQQHPDWNFLGLEIRETLVHQAQFSQQALQLTNVHFIACNVNNSLQPLLDALQPGTLQRISIQFPDPWFKNRHRKRRVVQPEMVNLLAQHLVSGGIVLLQSDIKPVAVDMCDRFAEHSAFQRDTAGWLPHNPLSAQTEREQMTASKGNPVYRAVFVRR